MNLKAIQLQAQVIQAIRQFFSERGFQEIVVPVLHPALPLEPNIFAFETVWQTPAGNQKLYLSTSPESTLKKAMAGGVGNCFAIGHCARNLEGSGSRHRPEFLMLEWYRLDATYREIMKETQELVQFVAKSLPVPNASPKIDLTSDWPVLSLEDLFREHAGLEIRDLLTDEALFSAAKNKGYSIENASWSQVFDQVFLNEIEPKLPRQPCFLIDFPARLSPLCQVRADKPYLAKRFEVFINAMEIGNGNTENLSATVVASHFDHEDTHRRSLNLATHPVDQDFLASLNTLEREYASVAGIGLGIDRLAMVLGGITNIKEFEI